MPSFNVGTHGAPIALHYEETRYLANYGSARVGKAALLGATPPFPRRRGDDPERLDGRVLEDLKMAMIEDRFAYLKEFVDTWATDFGDDLPNIDVSVFVVHGTEDRILPLADTADRLHELTKDMRLVRVEGGLHDIDWTHSDQVNSILLEFLKEPVGAAQPAVAA
ncbi:MAG TPA: alpha/beta hydrolase [Solirubrobacterales bacterium]